MSVACQPNHVPAPHGKRDQNGALPCRGVAWQKTGGEGGIRTLGTLLEYGALAKRCFRPLSHLTSQCDNLIQRWERVNRKELSSCSDRVPLVSNFSLHPVLKSS